MHETRPRGPRGSSASAVGVRSHDEQLDDWLGEISDEDWSENAAERAERRRATPAYQGLPSPPPEARREPRVEQPVPDRQVDTAAARHQVVERRRIVAGLVVLGVIGVAVLVSVLLFRGGGETSGTTPAGSATTTTTPSQGSSSPPAGTTTTPAQSSSSPPAGTTTTPSESGSPSTPDTTPSTSGASGFTLPEGTKLRLGEGDPAVVSQLQQALASAGYDPGPVDGDFGEQTEAAVTAFQQDNGLSADGVVGPETASALNSALSSG